LRSLAWTWPCANGLFGLGKCQSRNYHGNRQAYVPVPDNSTTIGFDDALSLIVTVPDFAPLDIGENVTLIGQLAPAATLDPQFDFIPN
jgi:hypothetical protein